MSDIESIQEQTTESPKTPLTGESLVSEKPSPSKKNNRRKQFLSIGSVFLFLAITLGVVLWKQSQTPLIKKHSLSPTPVTNLSQEVLKINEDNIAEEEKEIAYLQNGKIWFIDKNLAKKMEYEPTGNTATITNFVFSPDGQELYWLTEAGELWKKNKSGGSYPLVTQANEMTSTTFEDPITKTVTNYLKGKVAAFYLSPNGEYIAYETLETFTGCCMSSYDIPVNEIKIMRSDGTNKITVEKPVGVTRSMLFFDGWFSNSQKLLFHYSHPDEATQGSSLYEVGIDGRNPLKFTGIDFDEFGNTITVAGAVPVFSPDGEKMAYVEGGVMGEGKSWLSNIDGTGKKQLTIDGEYSFTSFGWSIDGKLLLVNSDTTGKSTVFNQQAEVVYQTTVERINKNDSIRSVISPDNKLVAVLSANKLLVINLGTKEKKELSIPTSGDQIQLYPQHITESGRFYYLKDTNQKTKSSFPQLWVIDSTSLKISKIADNASLVRLVSSL